MFDIADKMEEYCLMYVTNLTYHSKDGHSVRKEHDIWTYMVNICIYLTINLIQYKI